MIKNLQNLESDIIGYIIGEENEGMKESMTHPNWLKIKEVQEVLIICLHLVLRISFLETKNNPLKA